MLSLETLNPTSDRLIVRPDPVPEVTAGGIHIPSAVNADNPNYFTMSGTVLKVGPGAIDPEDGRRVPMGLAVGDRVVFGRYAGKQLTVVDVPHPVLLMRASEVMGTTDVQHHVQPGYQAAKHKPVTGSARPMDPDYQSPSNLVIR